MRNIGTVRTKALTAARRANALAAAQGWRAPPCRRASRQAAGGRGCARPRPAPCVFGDGADAEGFHELLLAAFFDASVLRTRECVTVDLEMPANAQIVLEAMSSPASAGVKADRRRHWLLLEHPDDYPVFHLTCITRRKQPIYLTTVVGIPPMGRMLLPRQSQRAHFSSADQENGPGNRRQAFPGGWDFPQHCDHLDVDKRYPGHARKIMNACWGLGQLMFSKTVIVVDKDVDVQNEAEVAWIVGTTTIRNAYSSRVDPSMIWTMPPISTRIEARWDRRDRKWPTQGFTRPGRRRLRRRSRPRDAPIGCGRRSARGGNRRWRFTAQAQGSTVLDLRRGFRLWKTNLETWNSEPSTVNPDNEPEP